MRLVLVVLALLCLRTPSAHACKCAVRDDVAAIAEGAKLVFLGTITKERKGKQTTRYDVRVDNIWKGAVGKTVTVDTGDGRNSCSRAPLGKGKKVVGEQWLFIFNEEKPPLSIWLCNSSRRADETLINTVTEKLGAPKKP